MIVLILKTIKGYRWPVIIISILLTGFGILFPTTYSTFGPEGSPEFWENLPKGMSALMKTEAIPMLSAGLNEYVATGLRHPLVLIIMSAFAIGTATSALAKEIEQRTILVLLAQPIKRYILVTSRWIASLIGIVFLTMSLLIGVLIGVLIEGFGNEFSVKLLMFTGVNTLCLGTAILGYSYLISAKSDEGGRATLLAASLTVLFFFIDFISSLFDSLSNLSTLSIFHYYDPVKLASTNSFPILHVSVLASVGLISFIAAIVIFKRRDITA